MTEFLKDSLTEIVLMIFGIKSQNKLTYQIKWVLVVVQIIKVVKEILIEIETANRQVIKEILLSITNIKQLPMEWK